MKKSISIILISLMLCSSIAFTACSDKSSDDKTTEETEETEAILDEEAKPDEDVPDYGDSKGAQIFYAFVDATKNSDDLEAIATAVSAEDVTGYGCVTAPVSEGFLNGFSEDIRGFNSGYTFAPMIGSIPFVGYIFVTDDPEALKDNLLSAADPRWNICTEADETFCETYGDYVFFVMLPNE